LLTFERPNRARPTCHLIESPFLPLSLESKEGKLYNTGNSDSTGTGDGGKVYVTHAYVISMSNSTFQVSGGFGHLGISVPDVYEVKNEMNSLSKLS